MARKRNRFKGIPRKVYSIIVDGKCEQWYFQLLKKHENLPNINIVPELPTKKKLKDLYNLVEEKINENYDKVIWVLDFDTILKESKTKELKEYLNELKNNEKLKKNKNLFMLIVNTPCLEFWYLLHLKKTGRFYPDCDTVIKQLKKSRILAHYEKSQKFYKKSNDDIYKKLKPYQILAIENAKALGEFNFNNIHSAKAEMYKIFEILGIT